MVGVSWCLRLGVESSSFSPVLTSAVFARLSSSSLSDSPPHCPFPLSRLCLSPFTTTALYDVSPPPPIDTLDLGIWPHLTSPNDSLALQPKVAILLFDFTFLKSVFIHCQPCAKNITYISIKGVDMFTEE